MTKSDYFYPVEIDGKQGYIDAAGVVAIEGRYDTAASFQDGLALVSRFDPAGQMDPLTRAVQRQNGFINTAGIEVVPLIYRFARPYSEGRAAVMAKGKWGYLDTQGQIVIEPQFDHAYPFSEGLALVEIGKRLKRFIDIHGNTVFEIEATAVGGCCDGLIPCQQGNKWCFLDRTGGVAFGVVCQAVNEFREGRAGVLKKGLCGFIDRAGKWVVPPIYAQSQSFSEGLCVVEMERRKNGKIDYTQPQQFGYIDCDGNLAIPAEYTFAMSFSEGLAAVQLGNRKSYGYIDPAGHTVIEPIRTGHAGPFHGPLACLQDTDGSDWYINRKGEFVWPN